MYRIVDFYRNRKKTIVYVAFCTMFLIAFSMNIPTWVLGSLLSKYSQNKLRLYNTNGTFWSGSGLLVAVDTRTQYSAPLILFNWKVKLGIVRYIDINFFIGTRKIANVYLNNSGLNLDSLNMSLSLGQVTELFGLIKNLGLSGNVLLSGDKIKLSPTRSNGIFNLKLTTISSSISPVNPLGDYTVNYNLSNGTLSVSSSSSSNLILSGNGSITSLVLNGKIAPSKKEQLLQFITVMGLPQPDGSYSLKIF
jgi:hypothetical protein